jgi:hypothetical protein
MRIFGGLKLILQDGGLREQWHLADRETMSEI